MAQDDDSFGLPDLNYKPLEPKPETPSPTPPEKEKKVDAPSVRIQTPGTQAPPTGSKPNNADDGEKSNSSILVGILVPILILLGGYFGYVYLYKKPKEKAAMEAAAKMKLEQEIKAKAEAARLAKEKADAEARLREEEAARNAKPAVGNIEMLSAPTGRYYVIAASDIDDDLLMDRAKKMSTNGISTKIIPPFGKWKYYRLTISDHDTFALAQASADEAKAEYNGNLWVIRY